MNLRRVAPSVGAASCLVLAVVVAAPWILIEGEELLVSDYYAAGVAGLGVVGFLALLGAVAFASAERGNVDPVTMAGGLVALGVVLLVLALLWWVSLEESVLYSFPAEYRWLEWHPSAVVGMSTVTALIGAGYAYAVLNGSSA